MDRVAWQATDHRVAKSQTRLRDLGCIACMRSLSKAFKGAVPRIELSLAIYEKNVGEVWWGKFGRA